MENIKKIKGGIELTKNSPLSGKENTMFLPISKTEFTEKNLIRKVGKHLIQDVFPELSAEQREFINTGITPEEWNKIF